VRHAGGPHVGESHLVRGARVLNYVGYGSMGASMLLFALAGLWS